MTTIEEKLSAYEVDVAFPDVSGMEHLQMLMFRSELHAMGHLLTSEQEARLATADKRLLRQAQQFYEAIQSIADLTGWRETADGVTPEHWWWYPDVLAQIPAGAVTTELNAFSVEE